MKLIFSVILILFFQVNVFATAFVTGTVVDATSKEPITAATVFIDGTTKYSLTDSTGKFLIDQINDQYFELVVYKAGFESINYTMEIKQKKYSIRFELIKAEVEKLLPDSILKLQQEKWGRRFLFEIFGISENASQCEIMNPDVLRFMFTPNDSLAFLKVTATAPLIIFNEALGYMITCLLDDVSIPFAGEASCIMYKWFKPLSSQNKKVVAKWVEARENVYKGSITHFMRTLHADSIAQQDFETKLIMRIYANDPRFIQLPKIQKETNSTVYSYGYSANNQVSFVNLLENAIRSLSFFRTVDSNVVYLNLQNKILFVSNATQQDGIAIRQVSMLDIPSAQKIRIEKSGAFYRKEDAVINGYWRIRKLADLLPYDYDF